MIRSAWSAVAPRTVAIQAGEESTDSQDPGAAVVGHPDRGAAAAVFAIDVTSGGLPAELPVVAIEQGGWGPAWRCCSCCLRQGVGVRRIRTGLGQRPGRMLRMSGLGPLLPPVGSALAVPRRLLGQRCGWVGGLVALQHPHQPRLHLLHLAELVR